MSKERFYGSATDTVSRLALIMCIISVVFIIGCAYVGVWVDDRDTLDVVKRVLITSLLTLAIGVGVGVTTTFEIEKENKE